MKRKKLKLIVCILLMSKGVSYSQVEISFPEFYSGKGVFFDSCDDWLVKCAKIDSIIGLSINKIEFSETLLREYLEREYLERENHNVFDLLKHCNRQYFSYYDSAGNEIIAIGLLNFKIKKWEKKNFKNWKKSIIMCIGDFCYDNVFWYKINTAKKEVSGGTSWYCE